MNFLYWIRATAECLDRAGHIHDKVEFDMVDFVEFNKVDRMSTNVERTFDNRATKITHLRCRPSWTRSTLLRMSSCRPRQAVAFDFVASLYGLREKVETTSLVTIRYDTIRVYLTCSKKLTGSQLSPPHGTNKKLQCETKNKPMSVIGPVQSHGSPVGKGKGLDTCYSATYMSQTRD